MYRASAFVTGGETSFISPPGSFLPSLPCFIIATWWIVYEISQKTYQPGAWLEVTKASVPSHRAFSGQAVTYVNLLVFLSETDDRIHTPSFPSRLTWSKHLLTCIYLSRKRELGAFRK